MFEEINNEFSISIYGNLEKYSDTISKGRCRIFYKGLNRNGTYITSEFAEKLLSTIGYAPVKGIYDREDVDYTDHGEKRSQGRIYGIVPENPNLTWEKHLDEDGIEREEIHASHHNRFGNNAGDNHRGTEYRLFTEQKNNLEGTGRCLESREAKKTCKSRKNGVHQRLHTIRTGHHCHKKRLVGS